MLLTSWLAALRPHVTGRLLQNHRRTCLRKRLRGAQWNISGVELLEDRTLLSNFVLSNTTMQIELVSPDSPDPQVITVAGSAELDVPFEGNVDGTANDDNGNGLDEVPAQIINLQLSSDSSAIRLNPTFTSSGVFEETTNNVAGTLDISPFAGQGTASSSFNLFLELETPQGMFRHTQPLQLASTIDQFPPTAQHSFLQHVGPVDLLDEAGSPSGLQMQNVSLEFDVQQTPNGPGEIQGRKFDDQNGNGVRDADEPFLNGQTIELVNAGGTVVQTTTTADIDLDGNGNIDAEESGVYRFTDIAPGDYTVREALSAGRSQTAPEFQARLIPENEVQTPPVQSNGTGATWFNFNETTRELFFNLSFDQLTSETTGVHIHEGAAGVNGPIIHNLAEAAGVTAPFDSPLSGTVTLTAEQVSQLQAGTLYVNLHTTQYPAGEIRGQILAGTDHEIRITSGATIEDRDFANTELADGLDFGDAPDPSYPTLLANDGARHRIVSGFHLGTQVDAEADGQPDPEADGDTDDGVVFTSLLLARPDGNGETANVTVTASTAGLLDAWIDFNGDGDWDDPGEQIFASEALSANDNNLQFTVPADAAVGETFARFRFSSTGGLSPTGNAEDGEVEDYQVTIERLGSDAVSEPIIIDNSNGNGGRDFELGGGWRFAAGQGFQNNVNYAAAGNGSSHATWTFSNLEEGAYQIAATWSQHPNRATDAPFTIFDGFSALTTVRVNQEEAPDDFSDGEAGWRSLGTFTIDSGTLRVRLSNQANQFVIADAIRIQQVAGPQIETQLDGTTLDNGGTVAFGNTGLNTPITRTVTVRNNGFEELALGPISDPGEGFTVTQFASNRLAPGASTTFQVQMAAESEGQFNRTISFDTNDAGQRPFELALQGSVGAQAPQPTTRIIDNGEAGFVLSGRWLFASGQGFRNDVHYTFAGPGNDTATWVFPNLNPGTYRVSATWSAHPNRATDAPYSILDGSTLVQTVDVNQEQVPNDFTDQGAAWEDLGTFTIDSGTLRVRLSNQANQFVIADAIRIESVATAIGPEIQVTQDGIQVQDGGTVDFRTTVRNQPITQTFTVRNTGSDPLTLGTIGSPGTGFTVTQFGNTTLAPGASTTFQVTLTAASLGDFSGTVSFATNDPDENPFNFTVRGRVSRFQPFTRIVDDRDFDFDFFGRWDIALGQGFQNGVHFTSAGRGSRFATWTFDDLPPGLYRVSATWSAHPNRATDAPYTIIDGFNVLSTVDINQELTPNDFSAAGTTWEDLGTFDIDTGLLIVELSNAANEFVIADAIRVERVGDSRFADGFSRDDVFDRSFARLVLDGVPGAGTLPIQMTGSTGIRTIFAGSTEGDAFDTNANDLDNVRAEFRSLNLTGTPQGFGPVQFRLNPSTRSLGVIEEAANVRRGVLDVPPFAGTGTATSRFHVFPEFDLPNIGTVRTAGPVQLRGPIFETPTGLDDRLTLFGGPVDLVDLQGRPTGISIQSLEHTFRPPASGRSVARPPLSTQAERTSESSTFSGPLIGDRSSAEVNSDSGLEINPSLFQSHNRARPTASQSAGNDEETPAARSKPLDGEFISDAAGRTDEVDQVFAVFAQPDKKDSASLFI